MDGPRDYHTKWTKPGKGKYMILFLYSTLKKTQTYSQNRTRLTDIENKLTVTKGERVGEG